ncbi:MAG TPA: hypothetical protein VFB19_17505 [Mycobacterium sp.]|nr:hypothetical protein [Mycobacterium sp.]
MATIYDVETVRRAVVRAPAYTPTTTFGADTKTMAEALALIAVLVVVVGAAAVAIAAFFVTP